MNTRQSPPTTAPQPHAGVPLQLGFVSFAGTSRPRTRTRTPAPAPGPFPYAEARAGLLAVERATRGEPRQRTVHALIRAFDVLARQWQDSPDPAMLAGVRFICDQVGAIGVAAGLPELPLPRLLEVPSRRAA